MRILVSALLIASALLTGGCGKRDRNDPVEISVIGEKPSGADPLRKPLAPGEAVLLAATTQGLVRYDGTGQIEPGLAIRWAISEDGLFYTFRLAKIDGIDADWVARRLRAAIAGNSRNPLKPLLGAVREIVAVTPEVVEIRLKAPRPNLLDLLAQPEMGVPGREGGTGPLALASETPTLLTLQPAVRDGEASEAQSPAEARRQQVLLRGERASVAILRFTGGQTDLVLGGRYADLPLVRIAAPRVRDLRFDPAEGLFGLAVVERSGFLGASENRRALAMAIDRSRILAVFEVRDWGETAALVPPGTIELPQPVQPGWIDAPIELRRDLARAAVTRWRSDNGADVPVVRLALPPGPGSTLLFRLIRDEWARIGVRALRVPEKDDADIRLIDEVAPSRSASWYLRRFTCGRHPVCSEAADASLEIARNTTDPGERMARLADADLRLAEIVPFIPLAQPLRWSLVAPRLTGFQSNNHAVHPLNHLLPPPN